MQANKITHTAKVFPKKADKEANAFKKFILEP